MNKFEEEDQQELGNMKNQRLLFGKFAKKFATDKLINTKKKCKTYYLTLYQNTFL